MCSMCPTPPPQPFFHRFQKTHTPNSCSPCLPTKTNRFSPCYVYINIYIYIKQTKWLKTNPKEISALSHKTQKIIRRAGPLWANLRIAKLWHCPKPDDFDEKGCYAGAGTVGSTEADAVSGDGDFVWFGRGGLPRVFQGGTFPP